MAVTENRVLIGNLDFPTLTLTNDCIKSVSGILSLDLVGEELPDDTLEIIFDAVNHLTHVALPDHSDGLESADGDLLLVADDIAFPAMQLPHGCPLWYFNGGRCVGKFYLDEIKRTGRTQFTLTAQSIIGVLDTHTYYGRMCNGEPCKDVIEDILLTNGLQRSTTAAIVEMLENLSWGPGVEDIPLYGWIPISTKRSALYQVLFAYGLTLVRADDGSMMVTYIFDADPERIADSRIYDGGSITIPDPAQRIEIVEHSYQKNYVAVEEIFNNDGDSTTGEYIVTFSKAPIKGTSGTSSSTGGMHIIKSCPNAALVTGSGIIKGRPYTHVTRTISKGADTADDGRTIKVDSAYMVTLDTSDALLDKLWRYYTQRREIELDLVYSGERLGVNYQFLNPYREEESGRLSEIKLSASAIAKYTAKFVSGYSPGGDSGRLSEYELLTGSGIWTVPDRVFQKATPKIRVVLIGGGSGGCSGLKGKRGKKRTSQATLATSKNSGGSGGDGGDGGKVLQVTIEGNAIQKQFIFRCGHGGAGGDFCDSDSSPNLGSEGGDTVFGSYSSADGTRVNVGIKNLFTGSIYAKKMSNAGASGGGSGYVLEQSGKGYIISGEAVYGPYDGSTIKVFSGGQAITSIETFYHSDGTQWAQYGAAPGGAGGAGLGSPGEAPKRSTMSGNGTIRTGDGGNGGDSTVQPLPPMMNNKDSFGWGGYGGFGGGAGGDTGFIKTGWPFGLVAGTPGDGGRGGAGGDGSPGAIIIYY